VFTEPVTFNVAGDALGFAAERLARVRDGEPVRIPLTVHSGLECAQMSRRIEITTD
jgi:hypothetical protein